MQYGQRATVSRELHQTQGIYVRDQEFTHFRRFECSVHRHGVLIANHDSVDGLALLETSSMFIACVQDGRRNVQAVHVT